MLGGLLDLVTYDIGIDLGTANVRIGVKGKGLIAIEPSVVAINKVTKEVLAVGNQAKNMLGRTPANVIAIRPLKDGVIVDFDTTLAMIKYFLNLVHEKKESVWIIPKPRVLVGVPSSITDVEKQAVIDAALFAGAREAYVIEEPMATAIGVNLPVNEAVGNMVVDIGGGTTDIAIISLGGIVVDKTINIAGDEMDELIVEYMKEKHSLLIGYSTAERVKIELAVAHPETEVKEQEIHGRDLISGLPKAVKVDSLEVMEAISPALRKITDAIKEAIEDAPPELVSDIYSKGIVVAGGGSQIPGLDRLWSESLHVPVKIAKEPQLSVLMGTLKALDQIETIKRLKEAEDQIIY